MGHAAEQPRLSYPEYLALEEASQERHELINGEIYAMAGGSSRHAAIALNIGAALKQALRGRPCRPTSSDQRIHVPATGAAFYADVLVVCGPYQHAERDPHGVTNPTVIIEVLSPSTEDHDRGAKFEHYRRLPSLQHFLLVASETQLVEHRQRTEAGWLMTHHTEGAVTLSALDVTLSFDTIYDDLEAIDGPLTPGA